MRLHRTLIVLALGFAALAVLAAPAPLTAQVAPQPDGAPLDPSAARPEATPEQRIRVLLSGYEYFPTRDDLIAVTPDAPSVLIAIYEDAEALPTLRSRAIDALGYFNDELTGAFFAALLEQHATLDTRHLHHAITAYAKAFGEVAVEREAVFLQHEDAQIRLTTITAFDEFGGRPARELLRKRVEVEKTPVVLERLQKVRF